MGAVAVDQHHSIGRRQFLRDSVRAGAGMALAAPLFAVARSGDARERARPDMRGRVVIAPRPGLAQHDTDALRGPALAALDRAVCELVGAKSPRDAWAALFSREDRVGIKTNTLAGPRLSPRRGVIEAVVEGLRKAGVRDDNIIIFDRCDRELQACGLTLNHRGGVRCFGTDSLRGSGYEQDLTVLPHMGSCLSMILTRLCTAVVNVPILKDHDLAGVSVAMKNFFGVIHNPNKYHLTNCNPYVAELAACPEIRAKVRLTVCDAIGPQYDGGPSYKPRAVWPYEALLVAGDMVAMDRVAAQIIEAKRREKGLPSLAEAGRPAAYIDTAHKLNVGEGDPSRIVRVEV